ncbi:uncharacterized protein METZ01_LOCUS182602, partial [marine metagenome]
MKKNLTLNIQHIHSEDLKLIKTGALVIGVHEGKRLNDSLSAINLVSNNLIKKLYKRGEISGKPGEMLYIPSIEGVKAERIYIVGCGRKGKKLPQDIVSKILGSFIRSAKASKSNSAFFYMP